MRLPTSTRILIVADQTADSPELIETVARRAAADWCAFTLLVPITRHGPHGVTDPQDDGTAEAEARLEAALPRSTAAAGAPVIGVVGSHDPLAAAQEALHLLGFDEVIVSMLPLRASRWLRLDLPLEDRRARGSGDPGGVDPIGSARPRRERERAAAGTGGAGGRGGGRSGAARHGRLRGGRTEDGAGDAGVARSTFGHAAPALGDRGGRATAAAGSRRRRTAGHVAARHRTAGRRTAGHRTAGRGAISMDGLVAAPPALTPRAIPA